MHTIKKAGIRTFLEDFGDFLVTCGKGIYQPCRQVLYCWPDTFFCLSCCRKSLHLWAGAFFGIVVLKASEIFIFTELVLYRHVFYIRSVTNSDINTLFNIQSFTSGYNTRDWLCMVKSSLDREFLLELRQKPRSNISNRFIAYFDIVIT